MTNRELMTRAIELAKEAGRKGGLISKRGKSKKVEGNK